MSEQKYYPTIGLEIHAELKTKTKMFSNSKNDPDETRPNVNINPIDVGHPGTLPTINKKAVEHVIRVGLAVNGEIANFTEFDRKNYFYPDIPKGYQISQYKYPIVSGGELLGVKITRVHLEEDTGTSKHDRGDFSLVDYNRAGIPLMELVTEPVIHSAKEASNFAKELQLLLWYLGVGEANMEKGEMRIEANVSVSTDPNKFGTKVEVKNLNSFKVVEKSIEYEIKRMTELLEEGRGNEIIQETRGFNESTGKTFSQRKKETSDDYRYFPEPDLPKLMLHEIFDIKKLKEDLTELPWQRRERLQNEYKVSGDAVEMFLRDDLLFSFFEQCAILLSGDEKKIKLALNYITSDLMAILCGDTRELSLNPKNFVKLIEMISSNTISSRGAKEILALIAREDFDPEVVANEKGLIQKSDPEELKKIVENILVENSSVVEDYKKGKETALKFLIGQGMKITKGSANPQMLEKIILELIK